MKKILISCFVTALMLAGCDTSSFESDPPDQHYADSGMNMEGIHPMNQNAPEREQALGKADGSIISNGTIRLGVNQEGNLNVQTGPNPIYPGVGLQYVTPNRIYESTFQGCTCEGWGVADAATGVYGYADDASWPQTYNVTRESFTTDGTIATSVVTVGNTFRVTHLYSPSPATPNLYEVLVTIENISGAAVADLRYTRVMDWDIDPTAFSEYVTIQGTAGATAVLYADDNGFQDPNPLALRFPIMGVGDFVDLGPTDHGALFDFGFGALEAGDSFTFTTFYGGADNEANAMAALAAVNAEVYSLGQSDTIGGPSSGTPATFVFAFKGVGGKPIGKIQVDFDVKPDDAINRINSTNKGVIPTAILGSDDFDVTSVDVATLAFGPGEAPEAHGVGHLEDVNGDGLTDMVLHFSTPESGLMKGDEEACVTGLTLDGAEFEGCDAVDVFK